MDISSKIPIRSMKKRITGREEGDKYEELNMKKLYVFPSELFYVQHVVNPPVI
jgi:hypothetical protein